MELAEKKKAIRVSMAKEGLTNLEQIRKFTTLAKPTFYKQWNAWTFRIDELKRICDGLNMTTEERGRLLE